MEAALALRLFTQKKGGVKKVPQRSHFGKRLLFAKSQNSATKGSVLHVLRTKTVPLMRSHFGSSFFFLSVRETTLTYCVVLPHLKLENARISVDF